MKKTNVLLLPVLVASQLLSFAFLTWAEAAGDVVIDFKSDASLRSLASTHLGDPNESKTILYYNGFRHPSNLLGPTCG